MKSSLKQNIAKLILIALVFSFKFSKAQCALGLPCSAYSGPVSGLLAPTAGTTFVSYSPYSPGTYFQFPMINCGSYAISTCGASIDTQVTLWNSANTATLAFNDDNGPLCTGNNASIDNYIPNFTNFAYAQVSQFNCLPGGSASINVFVRQNNNLAFTSSSAAMCSGQTRTLTATPAPVASVPNVSFGNIGAFTGIGVSGNVFTAPVVAAPTNYTITYTFGYVSQTQIITVNPNPTVAVNSGSICSGNSFTIVPSGASTYTIQGGSTNVSPISNTSYTVVGSSAAGCLSSNTATSNVTVNITPTVSVNSGTICSGNSFTIVPSGASTYTVQGGATAVSPLANSTYTVKGTSVAGCISANTATSNVTVNTTPTISVNSGTICSGNSFTIVPSGASTYTYSGGSSVVSPSVNTSYTVIGTSALGCVSANTATSNLTVNPTPIIDLNGLAPGVNLSDNICSGNSYTLVQSGVNTYSIIGFGSLVVSPSITTNYSVISTSSLGCVSSNTANLFINVNANPTITVNSGAICSGNSFTIVPSGASTYTIQGGSNSVSPTSNTNYTVVGTSAAGCISANTATSNVTVNTSPTVSVNSGTICSGNSFTITPSGASTYTIQGGSTNVSPLSNTSYTVVGTSAAGCISTNTATSNITVNATPTISVNSGAICAGNSFTIIPSGASTYTISGGLLIVNPSVTSNYSVSGTNAQGCISSNTAIITVTVNALPIISVASTTICAGATGSLTASGAATYTWNTGSNSAVLSASPLVNTTYTVNGTSGAGCLGSAVTATITVGSAPSIALNSTSVCAGSSATLIATGVSSYTWSTGANTSSIIVTPTSNTSYTVNGNLIGCSVGATNIATVTVNNLPTVIAISNTSLICSGQSASLTASGATTYTWDNTANTTVIVVSPTITTTYTVNGTNANGCSNVTTVVQNVSPCTGIQTVNNTSSALVKVYPNPSNGIFMVELENTLSKAISIIDFTGKVVMQHSTNESSFNIDISQLANGIYHVKIVNDNAIHVLKLVKANP